MLLLFNIGVGIITSIPFWSLYNSTIVTPPKPYSNFEGPYIRAYGLGFSGVQ